MLEGLIARTRDAAKRARYERELECPPLPPALFYLWRTFWRIRRRKGGNGFAASPIEWPDIAAFMLTTRQALRPWEIEVIEDLDDVFIADRAERAAEDERKQKRNKEDGDG